MFGKETISSKNDTSIISKGLFLNGDLISDGLLEIEGKIEGNVKGNEITIRECGFINGNVISNILNIKGGFKGVIKSQKINISKKANIKGTLEYVSLCVEDGASIDGDLKRVNEIKFDSKISTQQSKQQFIDLKDKKEINKE